MGTTEVSDQRDDRHILTAPFLLIALVLSLLLGQALFANNDDIDVASAAYYDTGMALKSLFAMLAPETFYNQNASFHSSNYGWTLNSILFAQFAVLKHLLHLDTQNYLSISHSN